MDEKLHYQSQNLLSFEGFLILKNSTEEVSSIQTQIYKVLQYIHALLWHIYQTGRAVEAEFFKA